MTLGTCLKKEFYPSNLFVYACFPRELKFIRNIFQKLLDTAQNSFSLNCAFFIIEQQRLYHTYGFEGDRSSNRRISGRIYGRQKKRLLYFHDEGSTNNRKVYDINQNIKN